MPEPVIENVEDLLHSGFRYALSLVSDKSRAEDLLQDAWLAVLKAKGPQHRPYLYSAIRSRFINLNKREQLVSVVSLDDVSELEDPIEEEVYSRLDSSVLEEALTRLRCIEREALFLFVVEGYTVSEIALFTQQPRGTVLSHIHRAKIKVRRFFQSKHIGVAT